ncbi:MAG: DNA replication protein DnaC, partial [Oscillospiraceae bacterium]|nr:DNA replication protein DnaC [Oscillospiraceae bacterium]
TETVGRILRSDLLILDDLGTELTTAFTQSALYNILETRLTAGKKMIFTTNLSDKELEERYIPQTVSRISGEFDVLTFRGRDIRAIRKERRYL